MGAAGAHGVLIYCSDHGCSHSTAVNTDRWPDEMRLSDIEAGSSTQPAASEALTCGLHWNAKPVGGMGHR
jgi:hypothetical protein